MDSDAAPRPPIGSGHRRRLTGLAGEDAAAAWYRAAGYDILDRNWRCRHGELDLVCSLGTVVVFCEVKARRSAAFGTAEEAVTPDKQRRIRRLAELWLSRHRMDGRPVRFDVAGVTAGRLAMLLDAF